MEIIWNNFRFLSYLLMTIFQLPKPAFILFYYVGSLTVLYENVVIKLYIARTTKEKNESGEGDTQNNDLTIFYGFRSFGQILILPLVGLILQYGGPRYAFAMISLFPLTFFVTTCFLEEKEYEMNQGNIVFSRDVRSILHLFKM